MKDDEEISSNTTWVETFLWGSSKNTTTFHDPHQNIYLGLFFV